MVRYIDAGPAPRGVVSDSEGTIYAAAFSRNTVMKLDIPDWGSHGVTVIRTADADLSDPNSEVATESVPVGFGPCSVSVFDPAAARLARETKISQVVS